MQCFPKSSLRILQPEQEINFKMKIRYQARWKELLDGFYEGHHFTVEMTMGVSHVYFPTEETWNGTAPEWARGLWKQARDDAETWSLANSVLFNVDPAAWVDFKG